MNLCDVLNSNRKLAGLKDILEANPNDKRMVSDVDQQLLIKIVFKAVTNVTHLAFRTAKTKANGADSTEQDGADDGNNEEIEEYSGPSIIKCFANQTDLDFGEAESLLPAQEINVELSQLEGDKISMKGSKFQRCHSLQLFIADNQDDTPLTCLTRVIVLGHVPT